MFTFPLKKHPLRKWAIRWGLPLDHKPSEDTISDNVKIDLWNKSHATEFIQLDYFE